MLMPARSPLTSAAKTGNAGVGETFGQELQRHRLAGAGRAGDEAMAVAEAEGQISVGLIAFADEDFAGLLSGVGRL